MISLTTPSGLFEKHENERLLLEELQEKLALEAQIERERPLTDKLSDALSIAWSGDPKRAAKKILDDVKEKALVVPRKLRPIHKVGCVGQFDVLV